MAIIEKHQGCPIEEVIECWGGPQGSFYTIFQSELRNLNIHIIISIILGIIMFGTLYFLNNKGKIKLKFYIIIPFSVIFMIIIFFLAAYFFPVIMDY